MEKVQLSMDAVNEEIEMSNNLIKRFQKELDDLTGQTNSLTERIKVMQAVGEKLPEGSTKAINDANINLAAEERIELVPQIRKKANTIKHYEKIYECLIELKNEYQEE